MEKARNMQKVIKKNIFLANTLIGMKQKKIRKGRKGGALIRAGAHIRDNTVLKILRQQFRPL